MHYYLREVQKVVLADPQRRCWENGDNNSLTIEDNRYSDGNQYAVEWVKPFQVRLAFRVTPSLEDVDHKGLVEIYEFIHKLVGDYSLILIPDDRQKMYAVGLAFTCTGLSKTQIQAALDDILSRLASFISAEFDAIRGVLITNNVLPQ